MGSLDYLKTLAPLVFCLATPALAQDSAVEDAPPAAESIQVDEEVIVRGRRLSEIEFDLRSYITDFLEEVAAPARGRGFARWQRRVCVGVHNMVPAAAQYIVDRISGLASEIGLEVGEPGCEPHVNIVFSTDAKQMASLMVESEPRMFRPVVGNSGMDLGLEALDYFVQSEQAVRWWHVSLPVDARSGAPAIEMPNSPCFNPPACYPTIAVAGPSRLYSGIRDDLLYVIIIVDAAKVQQTSWQQLADYLALVSLAQIDPHTNPGEYDSILNLFANPAAYSGLTDWDLHYLHALYALNQERIVKIQGSQIVNRMARRELRVEE